MGMAGFHLPPHRGPFAAITLNITGREFQVGILKAHPGYPHTLTAKLLAPEWHPVERFGPGDYLGHGLGRLLI